MAEAPSRTQKVPERKMSDDENRRLALEEKEKELELRKEKLEEREKEIEAEKVKKDKEKDDESYHLAQEEIDKR